MNYENYITQQLTLACRSLGFTNRIEVSTEQAYIKKKTLDPNTIYFIVKFLSATNTYEGQVKSVQIIALSEENDISHTEAIMNSFCVDHNYLLANIDGKAVKQEYTTPVVMSNFNEVSYGYRSVIYLSGTLFIMNSGVYDIENLTIDPAGTYNGKIKTLSSSISYSMSGNTQPIGTNKLATTVKNIATLSISFTIASMSDNQTLIQKIMNISSGTTDDTTFAVSFTLSGVSFSHNMRLTSMQFNTAPNTIPSIQVGMTL